MFDKWPFGRGRSTEEPKENPLIRIELPGLTIEIDRELLKTVAALWPWLLRGGRQTLPFMGAIASVLLLGMNGVGANIQETLCQQHLRDITPVAEDVSAQQERLNN